MARYLVTGAAGFIGAALASRLIKEGNQVVTIDNLSTGNTSNIPDGVKFIEGDCGNKEVYSKIPNETYDAIFHIAGQSSGEISFDDPIYDIRTNAESTLLLLKFALQNECKRFIYASTMSVYGIKPERPVKENEDCHPESFYGIAKLASEHYLRVYEQYGIDVTSLRLFNVYGPGQNMDNLRQGMVSIFLAQMLKDKRIHVKGSADRFRDFIHVDDVVESFFRCLSCDASNGKVINIANGKATKVKEIIELLVSYQSNKINVKYDGGTPGDIHGIYADISKMNNIFGTWNKVELQDGLEMMVRFYSEYNN
jgi:UDP-glucose 4-epimerase